MMVGNHPHVLGGSATTFAGSRQWLAVKKCPVGRNRWLVGLRRLSVLVVFSGKGSLHLQRTA